MAQGLKSGHTLQNGTYRIEKVLGQGNFGITYLATAKFTTQGNLGKMDVEAKVAIKEFFMSEVNGRSDDGSTVEGSSGSVFTNYRKKFKKEAENLSRLEHPNIVKVFDVFDENNTTYYVMEFLEGQNLDDYIKQCGFIEEDEAIRIISEIGDALSYMHSKKMLHLDIKPKNIMRKSDGKDYLIDFGLSKQFTDDGEPESSTSIGLGTPGYAPIEQAGYKQDGSFPATLDVYALGATLYKMLTGKRPPEATYILNDGFPERDLTSKSVSQNTRTVLEKAMAPIKKQRFQTVKSFINGFVEERTIVDPTPKPKQKPEPQPSPKPHSDPDPNPKPLPWHKKWWFKITVSIVVIMTLLIAWINKYENKENLNSPSVTLTDSIATIKEDAESISAMDDTVPSNFIKLDSGRLKDKTYNKKKDIYEYPEYNIDGFYIDAYELTQGEYKKVMGELKTHNYTYESIKPKGTDWGEQTEIQLKDDNLPVIGKFRDFAEYCNKRSLNEGFDGFYVITPSGISVKPDGNGYRLPTALEWTFAAKGGNLNEKYKHIGSDDLKEVAWYGGNSGNKPHPVGVKKPNGAGLYDMAGNIQEFYHSGENNNDYSVAGTDYMTWKQMYDDDWWSPYCRGHAYGHYQGWENTVGCRIVLIPKGMNNQNLATSVEY